MYDDNVNGYCSIKNESGKILIISIALYVKTKTNNRNLWDYSFHRIVYRKNKVFIS